MSNRRRNPPRSLWRYAQLEATKRRPPGICVRKEVILLTKG